MMVMLYNWIRKIRKNEYAPKRWIEGGGSKLIQERRRLTPLNCRGTTLLSTISTVGKTFCKLLDDHDRTGTKLEKDEKISEGQSEFRPHRSCVDHVYILGKIIQGSKDAGLTTYSSLPS